MTDIDVYEMSSEVGAMKFPSKLAYDDLVASGSKKKIASARHPDYSLTIINKGSRGLFSLTVLRRRVASKCGSPCN